MSAWTNAEVPDRFDTKTQLREKIFDLENKIKWLNAQLDNYDREFHNIPKAIEEFGYVELKCDGRTIKIGLIP